MHAKAEKFHIISSRVMLKPRQQLSECTASMCCWTHRASCHQRGHFEICCTFGQSHACRRQEGAIRTKAGTFWLRNVGSSYRLNAHGKTDEDLHELELRT